MAILKLLNQISSYNHIFVITLVQLNAYKTFLIFHAYNMK